MSKSQLVVLVCVLIGAILMFPLTFLVVILSFDLIENKALSDMTVPTAHVTLTAPEDALNPDALRLAAIEPVLGDIPGSSRFDTCDAQSEPRAREPSFLRRFYCGE